MKHAVFVVRIDGSYYFFERITKTGMEFTQKSGLERVA